MPTIENYPYRGLIYIWRHEPQNEYNSRRISIQDVVRVINSDPAPELQIINGEEHFKHIGLGSHTPIVVITDHSETRIITAWKASREEVKKITKY